LYVPKKRFIRVERNQRVLEAEMEYLKTWAVPGQNEIRGVQEEHTATLRQHAEQLAEILDRLRPGTDHPRTR
jgi:hypothetical protein